MPRIISKLIISNSVKSAKVTLWRTAIGHFLYTHLAIIDSPIGVENEIGSERLSGLTLKFITSSSVTKERFDLKYNNT